MRTTTIFAETHTSERANHVAYRLVFTLLIVHQKVCKKWTAIPFRTNELKTINYKSKMASEMIVVVCSVVCDDC